MKINFSKQAKQPNPKEIDYWVDISTNPYGNVIKYFNGVDWVDLAYTGGLPDLSDYYNKVLVNRLLNNKADKIDAESLVSDKEVSDVIKNISFTTTNPDSMDMVLFKYDGTNVAVTLPLASNTDAGIISSDDFKDFVKQWQLLSLYSEMYDLFADIRAKYQRKLKAGSGIFIDEETDTIHSAAEVNLEWDTILNKPDFENIYATKTELKDSIEELKEYTDQLWVWEEK